MARLCTTTVSGFFSVMPAAISSQNAVVKATRGSGSGGGFDVTDGSTRDMTPSFCSTCVFMCACSYTAVGLNWIRRNNLRGNPTQDP